MFTDKEVATMDAKGFLMLRKRYHVKRSVYCRWTGYDPSSVWRWETGKSPLPQPAARLLVAYIEKFRKGVEYGKTTTP